MSFIEKHTIKEIKAGEVIFHENDPGSSMFIIQSGEVEVTTIQNKQKVILATLGSGSIFGEMSLVDDQPRSATVTALTDVKCIEMGRMLFNKRLEEIPAWMQSFYQILVERLRQVNKQRMTLEPGELAKQIVFLLELLLSNRKSDTLNRASIPWQESAETIAFLLNLPVEQVVKVMNKLSLSHLAKGEVNYEQGRIFTTDDFQVFRDFSEFCKERFLARRGKDISSEYEEKSPKELQLLKLIATLMSEQATANDLHANYFENRCKIDLGKPIKEFHFELNELVRKGILASRVDMNGDRYFEVNRELLAMKLNVGTKLELFETVESKLG